MLCVTQQAHDADQEHELQHGFHTQHSNAAAKYAWDLAAWLSYTHRAKRSGASVAFHVKHQRADYALLRLDTESPERRSQYG